MEQKERIHRLGRCGFYLGTGAGYRNNHAALAQNKSDKTPMIIHSEGKMKDWTTIHSEAMTQSIIPVYQNWHLNKRFYGELQEKSAFYLPGR